MRDIRSSSSTYGPLGGYCGGGALPCGRGGGGGPPPDGGAGGGDGFGSDDGGLGGRASGFLAGGFGRITEKSMMSHIISDGLLSFYRVFIFIFIFFNTSEKLINTEKICILIWKKKSWGDLLISRNLCDSGIMTT